MDLIYAKAEDRERILKELRCEYPKGTRVELIRMENEPRKMEKGLLGTVLFVDDAGIIHVAWDDGSSLGVIYGLDEIRKI